MILTGLKPLFTQMKQLEIHRAKFSIKINGIIFEVIYFIDSSPNLLAIGVRNENLFFTIDVKAEFKINTYLGDNYGRICNILGLTANPTNPFSPSKFYATVNKEIPSVININDVPKPQDIAPYRKNVEEVNKIYFYKWKDNNIRKEKVSQENLNKTRLWLGEDAYLICKKQNISSCWTDNKSNEKSVTTPFK